MAGHARRAAARQTTGAKARPDWAVILSPLRRQILRRRGPVVTNCAISAGCDASTGCALTCVTSEPTTAAALTFIGLRRTNHRVNGKQRAEQKRSQ